VGALPFICRRRRLPTGGAVGALLIALLLTGCTGHASSTPPSPAPTTSGDSLGSHTPTTLRHPCAAVPAAVASRELGVRVRAVRVHDPHAARRLECRYGDALDVTSYPDVRSLPSILGLYLGTDRLAHHPVDVPGADGAEVVLDPDAGSATLLAKQGFVTHLVTARLPDAARAERVAVSVATRLVAGNRPS
jgi:hypothetical protein